MEWIVLIGGAIALYQLWQRIERLENRLADIEAMRPVSQHAAPPAETTADAPAATLARQTPVPAVAKPSRPAAARIVGAAAELVGSARAPQPTVKHDAPKRGFSFNFEDLFGRQLPIWAGGITLAIAGFYLVVYAIDLGLLSPTVRILLGFAFGGLLIQGAFWAEKWKDRVADPRVPQALAGAGIATLYACSYLAGQGYGLIGGGAAFVGLALVTAGAVWLSFRFGLPCAVLGLIGGFAAPMMVASDDANLPILSIYLALVSGGLTLTGNRQNRPWLGGAALGGGLLWGLLMLFAQDLNFVDQAFVGAYLLAVGVVMPAGLGDVPWRRWLRAGAGGFAALQMAVLVDQGGYALLAWGLYGLLSAGLAFLAWRERDLRDASALAAGVAIWLLAFWPHPADGAFALAAAGLAAIFALVPLAHVWRGDARDSDVVQLALFAPGLALVTIWHFGDPFGSAEWSVALASAALAAIPAVAAWRLGAEKGRHVYTLEASAAAAFAAALSQVVPLDWGASAYAACAVASALTWPGRLSGARSFAALAAIFALYPLGQFAFAGIEALAGEPMFIGDLTASKDAARYLVPGVVAGLALAWRHAGVGGRRVQQGIAVLAGAGAVVAVHHFYRHVFAITGYAGFERLGMADRTVWEAILLCAGFAVWQLRDRWRHARAAAIALGMAAAAHFAWFTFLLHNPLWSVQAVGPVPVANLALAAYGIAIAALIFLRTLSPERLRTGFEFAVMALIPMLALSLLRQAFSGSMLSALPLGEAEDLLRSLTGIVLAIGYLLWGARREDRAWRIGSLVLMLGAVGKVFLVDAAGLEGLSRIASFMALGFSLIGIGWFYTRLLSRPVTAA